MLTQIYISHLLTIEELQLDLLTGTTVITGDTGAGKSILIDAIELALGCRAPADIVRTGQEKADISLVFDTSQSPEAQAWLNQHDLDTSTHECIIRRTINKDGRSKSYINSMPTTLQPLRELAELLINIHGQHEHQALLKSDMQRTLLDRFAGHTALLEKVRILAEEWHTLSREIFELKKLASDRTQRSEFLKFQLQELENLQLSRDELKNLDLEHKQLAHADELLQSLTQSLQLLAENEDGNASQCLQQALQALESSQGVDPQVIQWTTTLRNILIQVDDLENDLRRYLDKIELDPARLQFIEQRLRTLFDVARKHKVAPENLFDLQQKLLAAQTELETSDERLNELSNKLDLLEKHYHEVAHKLSQSRLKAAKKLADEITATIHELALPQGEFHVLFEMEDFSHPSPHGMERVIFEIKTNVGQPLQPLAKIASGGELSRISLAIHLATASQHTIPILVFDEVDVGIGGGTAEIVGKLLRRLSNTHQVLCVTHSPQVAAQGHQHVRVEKLVKNNLTYTQIHTLSQEEKIQELARMLGGVEITKTTLDHAKEMLEKILLMPNSATKNSA